MHPMQTLLEAHLRAPMEWCAQTETFFKLERVPLAFRENAPHSQLDISS